MKHVLTLVTVLLFMPLFAGSVVADDSLEDWKHSGTLAILTTPDGANLPESARLEGFPVLVRLSKATFDFRQAQPRGEDVRFSAEGKPLAYQIEQWDAEQQVAAIWVRVPEIRGNARQLITMHWGRANAESQSNGAAVFNESNGYVVAMHLSDPANPVKDEVGTVSPVDAGTESSAGVIGLARRFDAGKGIACGEKINGLPVSSEPNTTQAWIRAKQVNTTVVGWGNEQGQGKVIMGVRSPPHVRMDCYFSNGNVAGESRLPMSEWVHVVHTYAPGDARVYVNGRLDGVTSQQGSPLNIRTPARMWLGGWYGDYQFHGDIDEVRISNVVRSADWVRLEYENQKPLQTLVGTLVQPGEAFGLSQEKATLDEGKSVTLTAKAGGAEKVYWLLTRDGKETVVAVDTFSYTFDAGRIVGDTASTVRVKTVYPKEVKSVSVPVTIKEAIPEPRFTLKSPGKWNGRDTVEVVPVIENLEAMQTAGAGELHTHWTVSGGAVTKEVAADRLILTRSQFSGTLTVHAQIDNGGTATAATATIQVNEPPNDPWVARVPDKDEKPEEGQFYARDESGEATLHYNGTLDQPADEVFLKVYADDRPYMTESRKLAAVKSYSLAVKLKPGLIKYRVEFGTKTGNKERVLDRVGDLVCGDAYLINGQSNALATDTREDSPRDTSEWIRSYGGPTGRGNGENWVRDRMNKAQQAGLSRPNLWCRPVWKRNAPEHQAELGWWGMKLAKRLVASQKVPVFMINGAVGGTRIDEHQPTPGDHGDLKTIYGRMLWRVRQARMTHSIRAVIWHQGESDQGSNGPTGGYGWETYQNYFVEMSAAWKQDMPNIQHYYIYQIWPNACSMGGRDGSGDRLREAQRTLPRHYSNMSILSTLGIKPPGGCHYPLEGWSDFARLIQPLIERDFHAKKPAESITPPDLRSARYTTAAQDEIALEFDQPVVWHDALIREFYLDDKAGEVTSGSASGNVITLKLKGRQTATKITYLKERDWSQDRLLLGSNGLAALTFCEVPLGREKASADADPARILRKLIPDKLVVLTFDDGAASHATVVAPILKSMGFGGSFYVCDFDSFHTRKDWYLTWRQMRTMDAEGFEIGNHTKGHAGGTAIGPFLNMEDQMLANHVPKPVTIAWPFFQVNTKTYPDLAAHGYTFGRGGHNRVYRPTEDNPYDVPCMRAGTTAEFVQNVRQATGGRIAVMIYHGVPDMEHPGVSLDPAVFRVQMQYLKDNGYKVIAMRDLAQYIDPVQAAKLPPTVNHYKESGPVALAEEVTPIGEVKAVAPPQPKAPTLPAIQPQPVQYGPQDHVRRFEEPGRHTIDEPTDLTTDLNLDVAKRAEAVLTHQIAGQGRLLKRGDGRLTIKHKNNTYTGGTVIDRGSVYVFVADKGLGSGPVTLHDGASLDLESVNGSNPLILNGGVINGGNGFGNSWNGKITLNGNTRFSSYADFGLHANITGPGGFTMTGSVGPFGMVNSGQLTLQGINTYKGPTIVRLGTLRLLKARSLYNANPAHWTPANITVAPAANLVLSLGGPDEFTGEQVGTLIKNLTTSIDHNGLLARSVLRLDTTNAAGPVTISADIGDSQGPGGGAFGIHKRGPGTIELTGRNTFTGQIHIERGALSVASINRIGGAPSSSLGAPQNPDDGQIVFGETDRDGEAALIYTGSGEATDREINLNGKRLTVTLDQSGTGLLKYTGPLVLAGYGHSKTLVLKGSTAGMGDIAFAIADPYARTGAAVTALTKSGSGTWTLSSVNTYSGPTTVLQGTLRLTQVQSLSANTDVTIAAGATLALDFKGEMRVAKLTIAGLDQPAGTFSAANTPKSIKGTGTLKVVR